MKRGKASDGWWRWWLSLLGGQSGPPPRSRGPPVQAPAWEKAWNVVERKVSWCPGEDASDTLTRPPVSWRPHEDARSPVHHRHPGSSPADVAPHQELTKTTSDKMCLICFGKHYIQKTKYKSKTVQKHLVDYQTIIQKVTRGTRLVARHE